MCIKRFDNGVAVVTHFLLQQSSAYQFSGLQFTQFDHETAHPSPPTFPMKTHAFGSTGTVDCLGGRGRLGVKNMFAQFCLPPDIVWLDNHGRTLPVCGSMRRTFDAAPIFPSFPSRNRRYWDAPFGSFGVVFLCRSFIAFALLFRFSRLVRRRAARHRSSFSPARFASDPALAFDCSFKLDVMLNSLC